MIVREAHLERNISEVSDFSPLLTCAYDADAMRRKFIFIFAAFSHTHTLVEKEVKAEKDNVLRFLGLSFFFAFGFGK